MLYDTYTKPLQCVHMHVNTSFGFCQLVPWNGESLGQVHAPAGKTSDVQQIMSTHRVHCQGTDSR